MKTSQPPAALPWHLRGALACGVLGAVLAATSPSFAEGAADEALSTTLFKEARALVEAGDYASACPKFVEAQRLHAATGTALNIGDCFEKTGKLATAWGAFKAAETLARKNGDAARQAEAARRAELLSPRLPKLAIVVPPAARVPGFELKRDGAVVGEGQWGSSLPVDVGAHTIEVTAPGRKAWSTVVRVETDGSTASVEVPVMEVATQGTPVSSAGFWSPRRTTGVIVGSMGIVGLLVGAVAGGMALSRASSAEPHCQFRADTTACDPTGLSLRSEGRTIANVSNVALAIGGGALVAGVVLFATAPGAPGGRPGSAFRLHGLPVIGTAGGGISIEGAW